jgi:hypothetical protein
VIMPSKLSQMAQRVMILWRHPRHKNPQKETTCIVPWTHTYRTYSQDLEAACSITWKLRRRAKTVMLLQHLLPEKLQLKRTKRSTLTHKMLLTKVLTVEKEKNYSCKVAYHCE